MWREELKKKERFQALDVGGSNSIILKRGFYELLLVAVRLIFFEPIAVLMHRNALPERLLNRPGLSVLPWGFLDDFGVCRDLFGQIDCGKYLHSCSL